MAVDWDVLKGGSSTLGNPADLGPYRGLVQTRGAKYDTRADDQYEWAKKQFEKNAATADTVQKQALDTGSTFLDWAKTDRGDYDTIYRPAMAEQMRYAREYTTPERMAANRAGAITGVNLSFDAAADMAKRALMGYGVDPSSGRFAGLDAGLAAKRAATAAGAGTKSDRDTEMMGQQLLANAIRTGQVLPGQAANEAGVSLAAGNQAVNTGLATTASGAQTMGTGLQWASLGDDMMKEWKDSLLKQTQLGMQQNRDVAEENLAQQKLAQGSSSGIGAALGMGAGIFGKMGGFDWLGGMMKGGGGSSLPNPGSGTINRKGGLIEHPGARRARFGGMRGPNDDEQSDLERAEEDRNIIQEPYTNDEDEPAREHRGPAEMGSEDRYPERDWPQTDTFTPPQWDRDEDEDRLAPMPEREQQRQYMPRVIRHQDGGRVMGAIPLDNTDTMRSFDPEGDDYDYRTARLAGVHRGPDGHMGSRDPVTGMLLKGRRHPTFDMAVEEDRKQGYGLEKRDGRYYTQKFQSGGEVDDTGWDEWTDRAGELNSLDPSGYLGFGTDAVDLAGDIGGGQDTARGSDIFGETNYDQGEQIGGSAGSLVGRAIGSIWGMPGVGAEAGRTVGTGIGAMVQGHIGEGFEDIGRGIVSSVTGPLSQAGSMVGGGSGMLGGGGGGGGDTDDTDTWAAIKDVGRSDPEETTFAFAEGGDVPDEPEFVDTPGEEMGEPSNMVPPEASPSGGAETDDVHALLNEGEFVIPKDVTSWYGEKYFQNLIQRAYKERSMAQAHGEDASPQQEQAIAMSPPTFQSMGA